MITSAPYPNEAQSEVAQAIPAVDTVHERGDGTIKTEEDYGDVGECIDKLGNVLRVSIVGLAPVYGTCMRTPI